MEKSMTQEKNTKKSVEKVGAKIGVNPNATRNVKFRQMANEDIMQLTRFNANVLKNKSKRGNEYYQLNVQLDRMLNITIQLDPVDYFLIVQHRKIDERRPINTIDIWARFFKGDNTDGSNWRRYEFFVCREVLFGEMFTAKENALIEVAKIDLPFIGSNIELDKVNEFDEEAMEAYAKRINNAFNV